MLKRIKVKGYKSLRDVEIELQPLTVMFGPNAAGKSNFLDALQLLSKITAGHRIKDAFYQPNRASPLECFSLPPEGMEGLFGKKSISLSIEVDFTLSDFVVESVNSQIGGVRQFFETEESSELAMVKEPRMDMNVLEKHDLRYHIEIEMLPKMANLQIKNEYLIAISDKGEPLDDGRWYRYKFLITKERLDDSRVMLMKEYSDIVMLRSVGINHSALSQPYDPRYYPYLTAARQEIASWRFFYFEPRERMRFPDPGKPTWHIGPMGEELPTYLHTLKVEKPRQFRSLTKALRLMLPKAEGIEAYLDDRGDIELRIKEDCGISTSVRSLSDGTLRMLALLALVGNKEPPSLIGVEEPENGIHPRSIEIVARILETQASIGQTHHIVTTHSPRLVDLISRESLFVVTKGDEGTRIEPCSSFGPLRRWLPTDNPPVDMDESDIDPLTVSERILRGDFND